MNHPAPVGPEPGALVAATADRFPAGSFVVALSGGADSAVAAWVATRLIPRRPIRCAFVDHGWPSSAALAAAAAAIAERLDLPLEVAAIEPAATETAARPRRLAALEAIAAGEPIVTGHHADDVAESVVLNLVRGAGSAGLASIPAQRPPFVRPLIDIPAAALRRVAEGVGLPFVDDPANYDPAHRRNIVRHDILPRLDGVAPAAPAALVRSARLLAGDDALLEARAAEVPLQVEPGAVGLPAAVFATLPGPVASRVVRRALRTVRPPYAGTEEDVATVVAAAGGLSGELSGGLRCGREGALVVVHDPSQLPAPPAPATLGVPGASETATHRIGAQLVSHHRPLGRVRAVLAAGLAGELTVRATEEGERIDIGGGSKLVRDAMAEGDVPVRLRRGWPVVEAHGKIAWIAGVRSAAWAHPPPGAAQVLELTMERLRCWTT